MKTFNIGDTVKHVWFPLAGLGTITNINGHGIEAMWDGASPPYRAVDRSDDLILVTPATRQYTPEQSGDTEEDI